MVTTSPIKNENKLKIYSIEFTVKKLHYFSITLLSFGRVTEVAATLGQVYRFKLQQWR